ncbi:MAG: hypothetical protein QOH19_2028 [Actinomycetota bacterium]|jgi:hypothetical protein|nr:hypothetical protein [Actinomycetota bacterium]
MAWRDAAPDLSEKGRTGLAAGRVEVGRVGAHRMQDESAFGAGDLVDVVPGGAAAAEDLAEVHDAALAAGAAERAADLRTGDGLLVLEDGPGAGLVVGERAVAVFGRAGVLCLWSC